MHDHPTRRTLLAALPTAAAAAVSGCVKASGPTADNSTPTDSPTPTKTPTETDTPTREEMVERLPETSPLGGALTELVAAEDRKKTADEYGLEYRPADSTVKAVIELESDRELSDTYRIETLDSYDGYITTYVHVNDLVPLAMEDGVRKVRRPAESKTDEPPP